MEATVQSVLIPTVSLAILLHAFSVYLVLSLSQTEAVHLVPLLTQSVFSVILQNV